MRPLLILFSLWLVALQVPYPPSEIHGLAGVGEFLSLAAALAAFTVAVYRLGVWRQEMHNTKDSIDTQVAHYREELHHHLSRLEGRIDQLESDWWKEGE